MFIKQIRLKDYKRFHDLTIDSGNDPKRIVAMVGPNGCGKSSVFDAMLFLNNSFNPIGRNTGIDYRYHSLDQNAHVNYENVEIVFDKGKYLDVQNEMFKRGNVKTMFSFRSSFRYSSSLKIQDIKSVPEIKENSYGASSASDLDQRIEDGYRRLLAKYNAYRDDNDLPPSVAREHIVGELNNSLQKCLDLAIDSLGNVEGDKGTLYFKKSDSDIKFEYNVLSAGEKEVVDILLDLYLRKDFYTDTIYLIDEPELHLNTAIQRKLLIEINKLIPENCQIWIATHSIGFLRALQNELKNDSQIIEFNPQNKWASESYKLTPATVSRAFWNRLFETALDDLSDLVCPKTIIYCEGRAEPRADGIERGLDAIVYNTIFNKKYPDVLFVSSGGNTELDQRSDVAISIFSKIFPSLNILVLKDRDMASGKATNESDRQDYLNNNPQNYRVLRRFEIENYLYDIEVLKKFCESRGLTFAEATYQSTVVNIVDDNLKDITSKIKNCCGIKGSVNSEAFKKNLAQYITEDMDVYKELESVIFDRQ